MLGERAQTHEATADDAETERAVFDVDALVAVREEGIEEKALVSNAKSATKAARHITLLLRIIAGIMISYVFYRLTERMSID